MTDALLSIIKTDILSLGWIDKYAGLAVPITRDVPVKDGEGQYQTGATETFPVSCDVNVSQCWENGNYMDLVPNDRYKSVAYWEDLSGLQFAGQTIKFSGGRYLFGYEVRLRLVVWMNMKMLGYSGCDSTAPFIQDAIRVLNGISKSDITGPISIKRLSMSFEGVVLKDHRSIFGQYSYGRQSDLFMWPWDYFAINVKCQVKLSSDCLSSLGLNSPISC